MEKKAGVWPRRRHWGCSPRSDRAVVRAFCCRAEKDSRPLFLFLTAVIQGSVGSPFAPSSQGATTRFTYDSFGYLATSTTPTKVTTSYSYDANGNQQGSSFNWVNPAPPFDTRPVATSAVFDANDRQTQSIDVYAHAAVTKYDLKGRVYETDDVLANATHYVLDARDQVVQT